MMGQCVNEGIRTARRIPRLTLLLWFWSLVLGAAAAFPAWIWLGRGFDFAPEADRLLTGLNFAVFGELAQYDRSPVRGLILAAVFGILAVALLGNPLVSGGMLETMVRREERPFMERFWHGAGRYFWRFLRLLLYSLFTAGVVLAALSAALAPLRDKFSEWPSEMAPFLASAFSAAVLLVAVAWMVLALDFARVRTVLDDGRKMLRVWLASLVFVWRHPLMTFGMLAVTALVFALIGGIYLGMCDLVPLRRWMWIAVVIVLQQVVMLARAGLRTALVASELHYFRSIAPVPAAAPPDPGDRPESTEIQSDSPEDAAPVVAAAPPESVPSTDQPGSLKDPEPREDS